MECTRASSRCAALRCQHSISSAISARRAAGIVASTSEATAAAAALVGADGGGSSCNVKTTMAAQLPCNLCGAVPVSCMQQLPARCTGSSSTSTVQQWSCAACTGRVGVGCCIRWQAACRCVKQCGQQPELQACNAAPLTSHVPASYLSAAAAAVCNLACCRWAC
jgi:hypothetical protein